MALTIAVLALIALVKFREQMPRSADYIHLYDLGLTRGSSFNGSCFPKMDSNNGSRLKHTSKTRSPCAPDNFPSVKSWRSNGDALRNFLGLLMWALIFFNADAMLSSSVHEPESEELRCAPNMTVKRMGRKLHLSDVVSILASLMQEKDQRGAQKLLFGSYMSA